MSDTTLFDIYNAITDLAGVLSPDPSWPDAKCGECGYFGEHIEFKHEIPEECYGCGRVAVCRKSSVRVAEGEPACPAFVRRPKENDDATI